MSYPFLTKNVITSEISATHAKGATFFGDDKKKYLDFSATALNLNLPTFKGQEDKICQELKENQYTVTQFKNKGLIALSEKLITIAPKGLKKANMQLNNGADANESAFKRARIYRKRPYILSFYWSNLGESCETLKANGKNNAPPFFGGSSYFIHVTPPFSGLKNENQVLSKIELLFRFRDDISAIIIEPIMINAGVYAFSKSFLQSLRDLCNTHNISLIFDEVKTGFGWLGKMFAAQYFDVIPDMMTIGNGIATGFPLAGILMKPEYDVLEHGLDERIYGGHSFACQIALDHISYLETSSFLKQVTKKSQKLSQALNNLEKKYPKVIKEVRIYGLIAGIECENQQLALSLYNKCSKQGLVIRRSMNGSGTTIILRPPLIVEENELDEAVNIIKTGIGEL